MLDRLIEHFESVRDEVRMAFTQSAPGLSAAIYMPSLLADLAGAGQPLGRTMAYQPVEPQRDLTAQSCFLHTKAAIAHATGRCIADTDVAFARMDAILQACGGDADIEQVSQWLIEHRHDAAGHLPSEVEIELTTADPLPNSTLRPRGSAVGERGPMEEATFARLMEELRGRDDVRVVFGGFGDPLLHPKWAEYIGRCRDVGILGLAIRTPAVNLDARAVESLMAARVDVLNVLLDAASAETYARVHGADHYERVIQQLEYLFKRQQELKQSYPLVVCEMLKTRETINEMERFYDYWASRTGWAVIDGPSDYAGQWPDQAVMCMSPPNRYACERIFSRALVLADGRVTVCDQDFRGAHPLGTLAQASLSELWKGPKMAVVRESHLQARYDGMALCARCREWHRP
jgi:spiro-SPASM protein